MSIENSARLIGNLGDDPRRLAQQWRAAAEASAQQFPSDTARRDYYLAEADRLEAAA